MQGYYNNKLKLPVKKFVLSCFFLYNKKPKQLLKIRHFLQAILIKIKFAYAIYI